MSENSSVSIRKFEFILEKYNLKQPFSSNLVSEKHKLESNNFIKVVFGDEDKKKKAHIGYCNNKISTTK